RWPRDRARRPLSKVRRRSEPGRRLVRRRRVHDAGGAVRHGDDRTARVAVIDLSAASGSPRPLYRDADGTDAREPRRGHRPQHLRLAGVDALWRTRARTNGIVTINSTINYPITRLPNYQIRSEEHTSEL